MGSGNRGACATVATPPVLVAEARSPVRQRSRPGLAGQRPGRQVWDRATRSVSSDPGTSDEGLTPRQEITAIRAAMKQKDREFLARYGGFGGAMKRAAALYKLPEANLTEGVKIDDYSTYRAVRFADRDEVG